MTFTVCVKGGGYPKVVLMSCGSITMTGERDTKTAICGRHMPEEEVGGGGGGGEGEIPIISPVGID